MRDARPELLFRPSSRPIASAYDAAVEPLLLDVTVLGPVGVRTRGGDVPVTRTLERALLARLALDAGRTVSSARLVDDLWGERIQRDPYGGLQSLVHRVRRSLGDAGSALERQGAGYRIGPDRVHTDLARFEDLSRRARRRRDGGNLPAAAELFRDALAEWSGPALGEIDTVPFVAAHAPRLAALRLITVDQRVDVDLRLGRHRDLVPELEMLVEEHPLHEPLWGQLMLALYRLGAQADALRCYGVLRLRLAEQLGIDPCPELQRLEHRMLSHDPSLDAPTAAPVAASAPRPEPAGGGGAGTGPVTGPGMPPGRRLATVVAMRVATTADPWTDPERVELALTRAGDAVAAAAREFGAAGHAGPGATARLWSPDPLRALQAAERARRFLEAEGGPGARVAVAMHTGEVTGTDHGVAGAAALAADELLAATDAGQVVMSAATSELLAERTGNLGTVVDIGWWRLPDRDRPRRLYEFVAGDGPPVGRLRGAVRATTPLPEPGTSYVGRDALTAEVASLVLRHRVVTLVGAAGVGKSRLAVEAARCLGPHRGQVVGFCDLVDAVTLGDVTDGVARALGAPRAGGPVTVAAHLEMVRGVLILDNAEHVTREVGAFLRQTELTGCELRLLVTSRRALNVAAERVVPVAPLGAPGGADGDAALTLLRDRARDAGCPAPDDTAAAAIVDACGRLPLAIELAARRLRTTPSARLASDLVDGLDSLDVVDCGEPRLGSLDRSVAASVDRMPTGARDLLGALAACEGGCDEDAAVALARAVDLDRRHTLRHLRELCDESLLDLVARADGRAGYRMLVPVQVFARRRMEEDRRRFSVEAAHGAHYLDTLREVLGAGDDGAARRAAWVEAELANLRAAYERAVRRQDGELADALLSGLGDGRVLAHSPALRRWLVEAVGDDHTGPLIATRPFAPADTGRTIRFSPTGTTLRIVD